MLPILLVCDQFSMPYIIDSIEQERALRLTALDEQGQGCRQHFLAALDEVWRNDKTTHQQLLAAYEFAVAQDYDHVGLTAEAYLAHPLRVAEMAMSFVSPADRDTTIIALLHNVLEVGSCTESELTEQFGSVVGKAIAALTVDRSLQWDADYKRGYYQRILAAYPGAAAVKVLDKFDNIFMLCLNADKDIRQAYIQEIETHVLPMAGQFVPAIAEFFTASVVEAASIGYLER
jgi:(p)ppGpp synthase/HD superfamily hydrolase